MIELADKNLCTGCGACAYVCPKSCIRMKEDNLGVFLPEIDMANCIDCKHCQKVCPILNPIQGNNPQKAFAAWSKNAEERRTSASGGIAAEIYKETVRNGYAAAGAIQNDDFSVTFNLVSHEEELCGFKNSKYVFSTAYSLFPKLKEALASHQKVVVIGLPCQIAAIRKIFGYISELLLIDVVCHGATPLKYLKQHISRLEKDSGQTAKRMCFRDPEAFTYTFTFTLYNSAGRRFYAKRTKDGDVYQYGYHRSVSYRENCYHCAFAQEKRVSDITLSDYNGLGRLAPCSFTAQKVSCVLVNTERGQELIDQLIRDEKIVAQERPVREPILGDGRLRRPTEKSGNRRNFEKYIVEYNGDFERTMDKIMPMAIRRDKIISVSRFPKRAIKKIVRIIFRR